jgi:uroporphyrinogen decarboxylase
MICADLTHRARVMLALDHQDTDRVPISMICSGIHEPTRSQLTELLKSERGISLQDYLKPIIDVMPVGPEYKGPILQDMTDYWGVKRKRVDAGMGQFHDEIETYPLADFKDVSQLNDYPWPKTKWFDYSGIPEQIKVLNKHEEYCIMSGWGSIFEAAWYMRGFEQFLMDLILNPEMAHTILKKVTEFQIEHTRMILQAGKGKIDLIFCGDDIGMQQGLLISLDTFLEFIKPHHVALNKVIHEYGSTVIFHTDGSIMKAVPDLMDMGIDILQALQFDAVGMDAGMLKETYGKTLCFEGGVSVQHTLPFGTVEDVITETTHLVHTLGKDGGYILGPSHAIQAGTPAENVLAMFDTALELEP